MISPQNTRHGYTGDWIEIVYRVPMLKPGMVLQRSGSTGYALSDLKPTTYALAGVWTSRRDPQTYRVTSIETAPKFTWMSTQDRYVVANIEFITNWSTYVPVRGRCTTLEIFNGKWRAYDANNSEWNDDSSEWTVLS